MKITYEEFREKWCDLSEDDRIAIYNTYCEEYGSAEDALYPFEEDFFETYFQDRMEICRATFFGNIRS